MWKRAQEKVLLYTVGVSLSFYISMRRKFSYMWSFVLFDLIFREIHSKEIIRRRLQVKVSSCRDTTFTAIIGERNLQFCCSATRKLFL